LLSEVAESNSKELIDPEVPKNNTSILDENPTTMYHNFKNYIISKVDEEKSKIKNNIDVIKKTSSWNQERTKLFLNYLDETMNAGNHVLSEE
jgi:hypothetical protein